MAGMPSWGAAALAASAVLLSAVVGALAASPLDGLEPAAVWQQFAGICAIPHPSGHVEGIRDYLLSFADEQGLEAQSDEAGNVYIWRPGSGGGEEADPVVLQAHMDMVGAADDPAFNFLTTPITVAVDGDWVHAEATTLGADDGIGMAAILAVLSAPEGDAPLPPLVGLFTVDEETSMSGVWGVNGTLLAGAKSLVNLDTEVLGSVFVGSAGGFQFYITSQSELEPAATDLVPLGLHVTGLLGGHSGVEIGEGRANAIKICVAVMNEMLKSIPGTCITVMMDGTAMNAIPTECKAVVAVPELQVSAAVDIAAQQQADFLVEYGTKEPGLSVTAAPLQHVNATAAAQWEEARVCMGEGGARALVGLAMNTFHGVIKYSETMEGLPETSNGFDMVTVAFKRSQALGAPAVVEHTMLSYPRSSIDSELPRMLDQYTYLAQAFGADINHTWPFLPAWTYDPSSALTNLTAQATIDVTGSVEVTAVHAGLECAVLLQKMDAGTSAVSIGPTIEDAHTSKERVSISSVQAFYNILLELLQMLAVPGATN